MAGLLGDLFGGSSSSASVYGPQQAALSDIYGQAQQLGAGQLPEYYGPMAQAAQQGLLKTIQGEYLPGSETFNQQFQQQLQPALRGVVPGVASEFARSGRYGSGLYSGEVAGRTADVAGDLYGRMAEAERARQMSAIGAVPQFSQGLMQTPYAGLKSYADIVGRPTVMQQSESAPGIGNLFSFTKSL